MLKDSLCGTAARKVALITTLVLTGLVGASSAQAYTVASGWSVTDYVTGFAADPGKAGPVGLIFDGSGNLLVSSNKERSLHKVPPGGGTAAGTRIRDGYGGATGLAFGTDGRLYMARGVMGDVVELNPASGEVIRSVAGGFPCPVGLATDPVSGDLFVSNVFCPGGGIMRISGFQDGSPGEVSRYAGTQDADGLTFVPEPGGTAALYAAGGTKVVRIEGTNSANPGQVSDVGDVPNVDGIAYRAAIGGEPAFLVVVRTDGRVDRMDFDGRLTPIVSNASRGDLVTVGPDGCIYGDLQDRVIRIAQSDRPCDFTPTTPQPGFVTQPTGDSQGVLGDRVARRLVDTAIKARAPKRVRRGSRFTLTLRVNNRSANNSKTLTVTDRLPKGTRFVSVRSIRGVTCRPSKNRRTVTCRKRSLAKRKAFTIRIVVRAISRSRYTNVATVKSNDLDRRPGNNRSRSRTRVLPRGGVLGVQRQGARPRTTG